MASPVTQGRGERVRQRHLVLSVLIMLLPKTVVSTVPDEDDGGSRQGAHVALNIQKASKVAEFGRGAQPFDYSEHSHDDAQVLQLAAGWVANTDGPLARTSQTAVSPSVHEGRSEGWQHRQLLTRPVTKREMVSNIVSLPKEPTFASVHNCELLVLNPDNCSC
jgi:hypothetical protein